MFKKYGPVDIADIIGAPLCGAIGAALTAGGVMFVIAGLPAMLTAVITAGGCVLGGYAGAWFWREKIAYRLGFWLC